MKAIISIIGLIILSLFLLSCDGDTTTGDSGKTNNNSDNSSNGDNKKEELYSLTGNAFDMSENPLSGVKITITGQQIFKSTTTNSDGDFYFINLKRGSYAVTAEKDGFTPVFNEGVSEIYIDGNDDEINFLFYKKVQKHEVTLTAIDDTYLDERHPEKLYGSSELLITGYEDLREAKGNPQKGYIYYKYALIRFDVSNIPFNANIISASLNLTTHYPPNTSSNVFIALIKSCPRGNWSEKDANLEDIPTSLTLIDIQRIKSEASRSYYWDVTEALKIWVNESHPNYGFRIHSSNNEEIHDLCYFRSRENPAGGGPSLRIVYEI